MIEFELNGKLISADTAPGTTLLEYLRREELYSVKHGCDHGECGACAVLMNSRSVNSCLILMHTVEGKKIETLESFSTHEQLHEMQESFLQAGAAQCGFCTPGMLLSVEALDRENGEITEASVKDALTGNLCRCTGYVKPVEAAMKVLKRDGGISK
ncbi:MAG: (2Fe-2S)-binding protein [Candidatus Marinimicrobia bacterium]|nr:(2Fe-2S)-binding protein [Candidatus Neomarinimicrobiota bacterium]